MELGRLLDGAALTLATGLYLSYIPVKLLGGKRGFAKWTGAGLVGTLEGLVLVPFLPEKTAESAVFLALALALSVWLCGRAERVLAARDDSRIVLDEIVGIWVAAAFLPRTARVLAAVFVLFRLLDSVKLAPYRRLEDLPGGLGVVADDVGAAVLANLGVRVLRLYWPWLNN